MSRKKIVHGLSLLAIILGIVVFAWGVGFEFANWMAKEPTDNTEAAAPEYELQIFSDVLTLEGEVYDFINDEIDRRLIARNEFEEPASPTSDEDEELNSIRSVEPNKQEMLDIATPALAMIDDFVVERADQLNPQLEARLNKLRLAIAMRLLDDIELAKEMINRLPASSEKLGIIDSFIVFFAERWQEEVRAFALQQKSWANQLNIRYEEEIDMAIFNAAPLGKKFPNFFSEISGTGRESLDLDRFRGKYVLIDFWASWCAPCVEELPYIKEMDSTFSPETLKIIGVSLDADRVAFERFIKNYQVTWSQYYDGKGFDGSIAYKYGISSLPQKYLIDPLGIVVMANGNAKDMLRYMGQLNRSQLTYLH